MSSADSFCPDITTQTIGRFRFNGNILKISGVIFLPIPDFNYYSPAGRIIFQSRKNSIFAIAIILVCIPCFRQAVFINNFKIAVIQEIFIVF